MAAHVPVDRHLHAAGFEDRYAKTYLGQAHLAGTGPHGTACRTCRHWQRDEDDFDPAKAREAYCEYPLPGKRRRLVPAAAGACSFYTELENDNG